MQYCIQEAFCEIGEEWNVTICNVATCTRGRWEGAPGASAPAARLHRAGLTNAGKTAEVSYPHVTHPPIGALP